MHYHTLLAFSGVVAAQFRGFNYGAMDLDGTPRTLQDFTDQFNAAKELPGTDGQFTSARLFTMIQGGSDGDIISAIQAAIDTDTTVLLGLWASAGQEAFDGELAALRRAIERYGEELASRCVGISIGSEDLYRKSPTGILNKSGVGASPEQLLSYIRQVRDLIEGTPLAEASLGHVDTWTAWDNSSNSAVAKALDWVGMDAYPYFQDTMENSIESAADLFFKAYDSTVQAVQGKPVWVTETGWPTVGPSSNLAEAGTKNARKYWREVSCRLQADNVNFWWFTLDDDQATSDDVSFSLVNPGDLFGGPLFDLTCDEKATSTESSSASASRTSGSTSHTSGSTSSIATVTLAYPTHNATSGMTPSSTSSTATLVQDGTFSSQTPAPTGFSGGNGTAPTGATPTAPEFEGSATGSAHVSGFVAVAAGLAAWIL